MIQIYVSADHWKLKVAAAAIPEFFLQLKVEDLPEKFTHTNHTREQVYANIWNNIIQSQERVSIETYRSKWPWSSVIGHAKPGKIFINSRKLETLHPADYVGNQAHELMHWPCLYRHQGNNPNKYKNLESVPYVIGSLAEAWFRGKS
jgi:hypothetical protein